MKLCTVTQVTGPDNREHYAVVALGQLNWPLALCGFTTGPNAKTSKKEAETFAAAPVMLDMLEHLAKEFGNINPKFPLSDGKLAELALLTERAQTLVGKMKS